jgi:hypothetical protein
MNTERFTLAELIDWLALPEGPKDRALVRRVAQWCLEHASQLRLEAMELAAWHEVVVTLRIESRVDLVVTGSRADQPGEWTWKAKERDFPDVWLRLREETLEDPYEFCVLDYAPAGRPVLLPTGDTGSVVVSSFIGGIEQVRVRLQDGTMHSFPMADVDFPQT